MVAGNRCDLKVVWPDYDTFKFQLMPNLGIVPGCRIVKRQRRKWRKEQLKRTKPPFTVAILRRAMPQFGLNDSAQENIGNGLRPNSGFEFAARILEQGNPDVGVREKGHYQS